MGEEIFRKKSLDKVKSPENLDDYIHVSNPSIWLLLISVIVLLIGTCVWAVFGHIDSTVPALISINEKDAICFVAEKDITSVHEGQTVEYQDYEAVITKIIGPSERNGYKCALKADSNPGEGLYDGKVILKRFKPINFIVN